MRNKLFEKLVKCRIKRIKSTSTITLCINSETQIFNKFTMFDEEISDINSEFVTKIDNELIEYLKSEIENVPFKNGVKIDIIVKQEMVNKVTAVETLIKDNIKLKIGQLQDEAQKVIRHSVLLALAGMVSIAATQFSRWLLNAFAFRELVIVMGWVFMWKAIELFFFSRIKLNREKIRLLKMYYAEYKIKKVIG